MRPNLLQSLAFTLILTSSGCGGSEKSDVGGDGDESCGAGQERCDASCAVLSSDGSHCGACGNACTDGLVCSLSNCAATCASDLTQCGSSCVDPNTDPGHCGECDLACSPGESCVAGACACSAGQSHCSGSCIDTTNDAANCGACGNACTNGASCIASSCTGGDGSGGSTGGSSSGGTGGADPGCTNVRPTGTMWDEATCDQWATETDECTAAWMVDSDYCNQSCGRCEAGGSGTGGGGGGIPNTCNDADVQVCNNQISTHCGYTYEYWKDEGTGCMTNQSDGFSVEWSDINNLLGRKGRRPGSANHVVTYEADYQPNGNSYLCVYGWSQGPLAEYYIVDNWYGSYRPPGGQDLGTVTSDGGSYQIYQTMRYDQPSIEGSKTFPQYWSVRTQKRTSGTITVKNHFDAWAGHGMNMGSIYEVSMTVEGYQSSGSADVRMVVQ